MKTTASKVLTIAVTVFSITFMGVTAVMWTVRTDWKFRAEKEFPKQRITEQNTTLQDLQKKIEDIDGEQKRAVAAIDADVQAIVTPNTGRVAQLEAELAKLIDEGHAISLQIEAEAKKVEAKQDEDKRLREEVLRLHSQYEDLVAQKDDALADVKRLRDLLFQARGVLDRVKKRQAALEAENSGGAYDSEPGKAAAAPRGSGLVR